MRATRLYRSTASLQRHTACLARQGMTAAATALLPLLASGCTLTENGGEPSVGDAYVQERVAYLTDNYSKSEHYVTARDGVRLFVSVYAPRDGSRPYPIMLTRTPYSCAPYGRGYRSRIAPSAYMEEEGYILVCADVRGRYMSEGQYDNMRPHVPGDADIDESSDTYDTIEWLLANVPNHNGRVGMWGISYPGFYTTAALPEAHPALVAASPQASISDFFFDDFHHQGAYLLSYWLATPLFGIQKEEPTEQRWFSFVDPGTSDGYKFFLDMGPLKNASRWYGEEHFFWRQISEHPNYDEFWQRRNILPHLNGIGPAVLVVGGLFDAEDLYGPPHIYAKIEESSPGTFNALVMGPWSHGQWASTDRQQGVGNIYFGEGISDAYQRDVEAPFFRFFLKDEGDPPEFEARTFDTGKREWSEWGAWPPPQTEPVRFYLRDGERLAPSSPSPGDGPFTEYVSDPAEPVPYTGDIRISFIPRTYMTEDQRFAERRPDVIEFQTPILDEDVTLVGELVAHLMVSTTGEDSDWVVKLIDVYPDDTPNEKYTPDHIELGGYQLLVRSEVLRGRFRHSFEHPEPFVPGEVTEVEVPLQMVHHTFKVGHRIMVQVQSTWFPLIDRNPQSWVDNIFQADEDDFVSATQRVYHSVENASWVEGSVLR